MYVYYASINIYISVYIYIRKFLCLALLPMYYLVTGVTISEGIITGQSVRGTLILLTCGGRSCWLGIVTFISFGFITEANVCIYIYIYRIDGCSLELSLQYCDRIATAYVTSGCFHSSAI